MCRISRIRTSSVLAVVMAMCGAADAHNLYVLIEPQPDGPDLVNVIFEHSPYPGEGLFNKPLLDRRGTTWVQPLGSKEKVTLKLAEQTRLGKEFLQAKTDTKGPRAIVHSTKWGLFNGRPIHFHGKYLDVSSKDEAAKVARTAELPLDLVPSFDGDALKVTVQLNDKPLAETRVSIWSPGSKGTEQTTDSDGVITVPNPKKGTWSFFAEYTGKDPTGKFKGGVKHGTSLNLRLPLE